MSRHNWDDYKSYWYGKEKKCKCGNIFIFTGSGQCSSCRSYSYKLYGSKRKDFYNRNRRKKVYGLTEKELQFLESIKSCQICGGPPGKKGFHIDHDHSNGRVRGILCSKCNVGLGQFNDSPEVLQSAIHYLENIYA